MNMKRALLVLFAIIFLGPVASFSQINESTSFGKPSIHVMQYATFATATFSTTLASTTAVAVTALTGRDYIEIRAGATDSQEIWVGIDTTPGIGTGSLVTKDSPLKLYLDSSFTIKTIASGAWSMSVFQGAY